MRGLSDPFVAVPLAAPFDRRFPRRSAQPVLVDGVEGIAASRDGSSSVAWVKDRVVYVVSGRGPVERIVSVADSLH